MDLKIRNDNKTKKYEYVNSRTVQHLQIIGGHV